VTDEEIHERLDRQEQLLDRIEAHIDAILAMLNEGDEG
jgi:hypothetical protein